MSHLTPLSVQPESHYATMILRNPLSSFYVIEQESVPLLHSFPLPSLALIPIKNIKEMPLPLDNRNPSLDTVSPQSLMHSPRLPARDQVVVRAMKKERRGTIAPPHNLRERACGDDFRVSGGGEGVPIRGVGVCCCCLGFAGETV